MVRRDAPVERGPRGVGRRAAAPAPVPADPERDVEGAARPTTRAGNRNFASTPTSRPPAPAPAYRRDTRRRRPAAPRGLAVATFRRRSGPGRDRAAQVEDMVAHYDALGLRCAWHLTLGRRRPEVSPSLGETRSGVTASRGVGRRAAPAFQRRKSVDGGRRPLHNVRAKTNARHLSRRYGQVAWFLTYLRFMVQIRAVTKPHGAFKMQFRI